MTDFTLSGHIVDIVNKRIFPGTVRVARGKIVAVDQEDEIESGNYILPGFIDAHVHIESSMLVPSEFARLATVHGTVATVSDPHEIANVLGMEGIRYMIDNSRLVPFHFYFGASSCVPATSFETAGAEIGPKEIRELFSRFDLHYLSEMMNYPGVLNHDPVVMEKIAVAKSFKKPVDGHSPGLRGEEAVRYINAGITTDHECFTFDEGLHKVQNGMKIIIREGSAAKNFEALHPLIKSHPSEVMFCSDDKHPHELVQGHINLLVRRALEKGYDLMDVLRVACFNPVQHYKMDVGLLRVGDNADFIVVDNLSDLNVKETWIKGELVAKSGKPLIKSVAAPILNHFQCSRKSIADFTIPARPGKLRVIHALDGQLITKQLIMDPCIKEGVFAADPKRDLLKITVVNRYRDAPPAVAFASGFGLAKGAIASCVAHDSHNIVCVGVDDKDICAAVNALIDSKGGISAAVNGEADCLPLPVAGIISPHDGYQVAEDYSKMDRLAKTMGTALSAPYMTLSFMSLLVIPSLKLSDKGLFDGTRFEFTDLVVEESSQKP